MHCILLIQVHKELEVTEELRDALKARLPVLQYKSYSED